LTGAPSLPPEPPGPSLREHAVAQALCVVAVVVLFQLWHADLRVPFSYGGDAFFTLMLTKGGIDAGWYFTNPWLGAPFRLEMFDHPVAGTLHFAFLKLFSLITRDAPLSINLYYLLGYPLCTFSALSVLRRLGLGALPALVAALLFAFLPYHVIRGEGHLFLAGYYAIPPAILLLHWVASDRLRLTWPLDRRALSALGISVLLASTSIYYSCFTAALLLLHGVLTAIRPRRAGARRSAGLELRPLATALLLVGALAAAFAANIAPNLLHMATHGRNRDVANRSQVESELYGLRIGSMLMPIPDHRVKAFAEARARYDRNAATAETTSSALGLVGSVGFALLVAELFRRRRDELSRFLAESNLALLLLGVTGGIGSLAALFVTPLIRAYTRVSVFIGFLALAFVLRELERCLPWIQGRLRSPYAGQALLAGVLVFGLADQSSARWPASYAGDRKIFEDDQRFVRRIESQLPARAAIFVLPYLAFPEAVDRIAVNELFRGYMHSRDLRFSAGAMNGTYPALWQERVAAEPPATMVETLALAGFDGIYLDRRALPNRSALEREFDALLGPVTSNGNGDLGFFSLERVRARLSGTERWAERERVLRRVLARWSGFFGAERDDSHSWRWSSGKSEIRLLNPDTRARDVHLKLRAYAISPSVTRLRVSGAESIDFALGSNRPVYETTLTVPPGGVSLFFESEGRGVPPAGDQRTLAFAIEDFSLQAAD